MGLEVCFQYKISIYRNTIGELYTNKKQLCTNKTNCVQIKEKRITSKFITNTGRNSGDWL